MKSIHASILVEGELGFIGSSSSIHDNIPERMSPMTTLAQASEFVLRTGVDVLAPALGIMHGMLKSMVAGETRKHLDPERIAAIKHAVRKPLTLHMACSILSETQRPFNSSRRRCTVHAATAPWCAPSGPAAFQFRAFASCKSA